MSAISKSGQPISLMFMPLQGAPAQLFVLLHGESAGPRQLLSLAHALKVAFPQALIVLPYGPVRENVSSYHWLERVELALQNEMIRVADALPALIALIQQIQNEHDLSGEQTALGGFSQGATMALEAVLVQPDLAGRVLAFSGTYVSPLMAAPSATTLHFLHGSDDTEVPLARVQKCHARLAKLQGDATLDVARNVGHELHGALIEQAIHRLQTCVPLHRWKAALSELNIQLDTPAADDPHDGPPSPPKTLH